MALKFNLKTEIVPLQLTAADGSVNEYELREMTAAMRDRYMSALGARVQFNDKGEPAGIKSFDGMQADLITQCLFDSTGKLVTKEEVQSWPASVVSDIFKEAQKLNRLDRDASAEEGGDSKND